MPRKEAIRKCATCGISVRTKSGSDGEDWYCKDHRLCISPECSNVVYYVNSMCRSCHKSKRSATAYSNQVTIGQKCDHCGFMNKWGEHYYLTHKNSLRCNSCKKYVTKEIEEKQESNRKQSARRCAWCYSRLSAYNKGKICNACWTGASIRERSKRKWSSESRILV